MKKGFIQSVISWILSFAVVLNLSGTVLAEEIFIDVENFDEDYKAQSLSFPRFGNRVDYSRGNPTSSDEEYQDYKEYIASRHVFEDMIGHSSEVSAVRLAEKGVFPESQYFSPDDGMTVMQFMKSLITLCGRSDLAAEGDDEIKNTILTSGLIEDSVTVDFSAEITNELLAYFLGRAVNDTANSAQYKLLLDDYNDINESLRDSVLDSVAAGITEITDFKLNPDKIAKRSDIADGLYRLSNAAARVIPLFDLGAAYDDGKENYLVKSTYEKNERGIQFGFFTNYNKQADAFLNYGTMPIDRTGFYKWSKIETTEGKYNMPNFNNDKSSHKAGNTIINCIDISANFNWNPSLSESNIPEFYTQDIRDSETRNAAKEFLYDFVTEMLVQVDSDVLLAIDYELDSHLGIWNEQKHLWKADAFAEWYKEACEVARQAAADLGKSDSLKLIVIYNNITSKHLEGVSENQWMLDIAEVSDYIGIDTYNFYNDKTDPSYTIQNIRFLMNNYSLGKPVIVVENGLGISRDFNEIDSETGLTQMELSEQYYKNLFCEFRFSLEKGDFLNANLEGFLIWSYYDTNETSDKTYGLADDDNTLRDNGIAVKEGINSLYKQKQFNPSKLKEVTAVADDITVKGYSGTEYDELTIISQGSGDDGTAAVSVELEKQAAVYVTVNGEGHYTDYRYSTSHSVEIDNLREGTNVIKIRFGCEQTPYTIKVKSAQILFNEKSEWESMSNAPSKSLLSGKTPISIITSKGNNNSVSNATGGTSLSLWTNGIASDNVSGLYMHSSKGMTIAYDLEETYAVNNVLLTSGSLMYPTETRWKAYLSNNSSDLFCEENCIAYVTNDAKNARVTQFADVTTLKTGRYFGIKLLDNGTEDSNAYISEIGVYLFVGDANMDGCFDARDLVHLKKYLAGKMDSVKNFHSADADNSGKLTATDLTALRNKIMDTIPEG